MSKNLVHLSAYKGCMLLCTAFRDYVTSDYKRLICRASLKHLVVTDLLEVAEDISLTCERFWMFRAPMDSFSVKEVEGDEVCHES